jgi:PIN domain nuclease of toxin-antitoxin system
VRLLLDTHAVLWWFLGNLRMPPRIRDIIDDEANAVHVSAASAYEVSLKVRLGKLSEAVGLASRLRDMVIEQNFLPLNVTIDHALAAGALPATHRDPFDRLLIGQAQIEQLTLVSNEQVFDAFGVSRLW